MDAFTLGLQLEPLTRESAERYCDELLAMNRDAEGGDWRRENLLADRVEKWQRSVVVRHGDKLVGYAIVTRRPRHAHLHHLVIAPEARNRGIGATVMTELLRRNADVGSLTLKVHPSNTAARRFYRRLGFTEEGMSVTGYVELTRLTTGTKGAASLRVAVHQPNYMPWCGFFAKMLDCDALVFLDDVQLPRGRSYVSRTKIASGPAGERWLTAPVRKGGLQPINDVYFADDQWARSHLRTLHHVYARSHHFREVSELVGELYDGPSNKLAIFNSRAIEMIGRYLGWTGTFHYSSDHPTTLTADRRIAQVVAAVGGSTYVSGAGAQKYQSADVYHEAGVGFEVRAYVPVPYERSGWPFVPGLSVLDALFHSGSAARAALVYD